MAVIVPQITTASGLSGVSCAVRAEHAVWRRGVSTVDVTYRAYVHDGCPAFLEWVAPALVDFANDPVRDMEQAIIGTQPVAGVVFSWE